MLNLAIVSLVFRSFVLEWGRNLPKLKIKVAVTIPAMNATEAATLTNWKKTTINKNKHAENNKISG